MQDNDLEHFTSLQFMTVGSMGYTTYLLCPNEGLPMYTFVLSKGKGIPIEESCYTSGFFLFLSIGFKMIISSLCLMHMHFTYTC